MLERPCGEATQREEKMPTHPLLCQLKSASIFSASPARCECTILHMSPRLWPSSYPSCHRVQQRWAVPPRRAPNADSLAEMSTSATLRASLMVQTVKNLPEMQEVWVRSLGWGDHLNKKMTTHSSILAWRIPWTEEPGRPMGSQRVGQE